MPKPSYERLAELIALYLYENRYKEHKTAFGKTLLVATNCLSQMQIQTGVLSRLKILEPEDKHKQYYYFDCEPDQFHQRAYDNKADGCSYEFQLFAASLIVEENGGDPIMRQALVDAKLLKSIGLIKKVIVSPKRPEKIWDWDWDWDWTNKRAHYDTLYRDWARLLNESRYGEPDFGEQQRELPS